jgi:uncharacterized protein (DUF1330 family)
MTAHSVGYLVVLARINDWAKFAAYAQATPKLYPQFGGRYLCLAPPHTVEQFGSPIAPLSLVVSVWPSTDHIHTFWQSPEYLAAKSLREGTGEFSVFALAGSVASEASVQALAVCLSDNSNHAETSFLGAKLLAQATPPTWLEGNKTFDDLRIFALHAVAQTKDQLRHLVSNDCWLVAPPFGLT